MQLFLPNRKMRSPWYLPPAAQLPPGDGRALVFDFRAVPALGTLDLAIPLQHDFVIWGLTAVDSDAAGFFVQMWHDIKARSLRRAFFNKKLLAANAFGAAQGPLLLKDTYFVEKNDSITVEIASLSAAVAARIQVVLFGVQPD